jgi:hypothetical protein
VELLLHLVTPAGNFSDLVGTGYGGVFMAKFGLPILDVTGQWNI